MRLTNSNPTRSYFALLFLCVTWIGAGCGLWESEGVESTEPDVGMRYTAIGSAAGATGLDYDGTRIDDDQTSEYGGGQPSEADRVAATASTEVSQHSTQVTRAEEIIEEVGWEAFKHGVTAVAIDTSVPIFDELADRAYLYVDNELRANAFFRYSSCQTFGYKVASFGAFTLELAYRGARVLASVPGAAVMTYFSDFGNIPADERAFFEQQQ